MRRGLVIGLPRRKPTGMPQHTLDRKTLIHRWDRDLPPRLTIASGDRVQLELADASGGQVQPGMDVAAFAQIDTGLIHALTGPVAVEGAAPGDLLEVEVLALEHEGWAWTSIQPGLGLLQEDFKQPYLHHWVLEDTCTHSMPGTRLELHPFCGVLGVQRAEHGSFRTRPPGSWGGNMDVKHLTVGTRLFLPVAVPGAGFCAGDAHAAQGDGEVCINGMEAPMRATFRLRVHRELERAAAHAQPYALVPPTLVPQRYLGRPFHAFIASGDTFEEACKGAVRRAIDYLMQRLGVSASQAYVLCSVVLDLKISQLVNAPVVTVTAYLPEAIFLEDA